MNILRLFTGFSLLFTGFSAPAFAQSRIAVAELFTAQGCGYAQAAQDLFSDLTKIERDNLIVLSCHVTNFDRADFKDPFSNEWCDKRHKAYRPIAGGMGVRSIPNVVVNGQFVDRASDRDLVHSSIEMAHSLDNVLPIQISQRDGFIDLALPKMRPDQNMEVWLMSYKKEYRARQSSGVFSGDNFLTFIHPVVDVRKLFLWDGRYLNTSIPLKDMADADGYAVVAQNEHDLKIIAAGKVENTIALSLKDPNQ